MFAGEAMLQGIRVRLFWGGSWPYSKYQTRLEKLARDKRSSLFSLSVFSVEEKKFYRFETSRLSGSRFEASVFRRLLVNHQKKKNIFLASQESGCSCLVPNLILRSKIIDIGER